MIFLEAERIERAIFDLMDSRNHVAPKRLGIPGPKPDQKKLLLESAGTAPIHGVKVPWHIYEISDHARDLLGEVFVKNLKNRDPNATPEQLEESFSKARRGPYLLLVVAKYGLLDPDSNRSEAVISAGCAIQNILLQANVMGYGAGLSSGKALKGPEIKQLFNLSCDEEPLVFITIGSVIEQRDKRIRTSYLEYSSIL